MKVTFNPGAIAKIFSALSKGKVTEDEFMDAQTPEQVDALLEKGGIDPAVAQSVYSRYSQVEDASVGSRLTLVQDDSIGPKPRV